MFLRVIACLLVLTHHSLAVHTDLKSLNADFNKETCSLTGSGNLKSSTKKLKLKEERRTRKKLQKDPYASLVLKIIKEAEEDQKEARKENYQKYPTIQDSLERSSEIYKKAVETRVWFKKNLEAQDADKKMHLYTLIKSIEGLTELPEDLRQEVYSLGILSPSKSWGLLSLRVKRLFLMALTLGSYITTVAGDCSVPSGSYRDTCRDIEVSEYNPRDFNLPKFCKLKMSCLTLEAYQWVPNTVFIPEGLERCVTEYGENCDGLFTARSTSRRLCKSPTDAKIEKGRISRELGQRKSSVNCSPQITPPNECTVGHSLYLPKDSDLPSLCEYQVKCSKLISSKTTDRPAINIRHEVTASQKIYLPPNAIGCLQSSVARVRESLDEEVPSSPYKDEL